MCSFVIGKWTTRFSNYHCHIDRVIWFSSNDSCNENFSFMKQRVIRYRKYKIFNNDAFVNTLWKEITKQEKVLDEKGLDAFSKIFTYAFDKHAPQNKNKQTNKETNKLKRYLRSNHKAFINNKTSKAIMTRTRLQSPFLKNRSNRIETEIYFASKEIKKKNIKKIISQSWTNNR